MSQNRTIIFAYVHGSFLEQENFNDIDIAVYLDNKTEANSDPAGLEISLSLELESRIQHPIDVKFLNAAPLSFRYHATKGRLILSRDENTREEFLCRTWSAYFDFMPVSKIYLQESVIA